MEPTWIAEEPVVFVHVDGRRSEGKIAIARPEWIDDTHAGCHIAVDGLAPFRGPIYGASPLQALLLGIQMIGFQLHAFLADGGQIVRADDNTEFGAAAFFGPLLRAPVADP